MLAVVGRPARVMLMSEPDVLTVAVAVLLPPDVTPPLVSLVAPVLAVTVVEPDADGVPLTEQVMELPASTVAGGEGTQPVTETPTGKPLTAHVALSALAVAVAELVHLMVPLYAVPTVAVAGSPLRSGAMSAPVVVMEPAAVLLAGLPSFPALVVPLSSDVATAVGVPETVQVIDAPGTRLIRWLGTHVYVKPAGSPLRAHVGTNAVINGAAPLEHENVPL